MHVWRGLRANKLCCLRFREQAQLYCCSRISTILSLSLRTPLLSVQLIDELDVGVITDFLPEDAAREILEKMKGLPDSEWTQIDNKERRSFGRNQRQFKASVDMDYKMYDLQLKQHQHMRALVEPLFAPYFKGEKQLLSLFLGKYQHGSYVTSHTGMSLSAYFSVMDADMLS